MVFKFSFNVSGDNLHPEKFINKIQGKFSLISSFSPADKKPINNGEIYGFGGMTFWHCNKFSTEKEIKIYEQDFVSFIESNYQMFIEYGANEFELFIEIYYNGEQCNFEVFNKSILKLFGSMEISILISVYTLDEQEILEWEGEISAIWI